MESKSTKEERQRTKSIGSGSPIKGTQSEIASVEQEKTQTGSVPQQSTSNTPRRTASSSTPINTERESKEMEIKPPAVAASTYSKMKEQDVGTTLSTPAQEYTDPTVGNADNSTSLEQEVSKGNVLDEPASRHQHPWKTELKEDQEIQQVTSELEYTSEAEVVDKVEPTSHILQDSEPLEDAVIGVMKLDESNTRTKHYQTNYHLNPFMAMPLLQLSLMELYNEFATNMTQLSLYWFDLFYKLWPPETGVTRNPDR
jgi:hypothetical protein